MINKKLRSIASIIGLLFICNLSAQEGFRIGAKGIYQSTWLINQDDSDAGNELDYVPTYGAAFGLALGYNFSTGIGIELDVLYSKQGQKYDVFEVIEIEQRLTYLKIPLLLSFNSDPDHMAMFIGRIGPQLCLLNGEELTTSLGAATGRNYEKMDFGIAFNFGAAFKLAPKVQLTASVRADYGFLNAEVEDPTITVARATTNNVTGGLEIGLNYLFLKKTAE